MKTLPLIPIGWAMVAVVVLHLVGVAGFVWEPTRPLFAQLVPLNLIGNALLLVVYHEGQKTGTLWRLAVVGLIGFMAELTGVNTGLIFGDYTYGKPLGLQLAGTPLMIGVLWAMLIYMFTAVAASYRKVLLTGGGALAMTLFDVVMEPGAVKIGLWNWSGATIPLLNYITWFALSALLFAWMAPVAGQIKNRLALTILLSQLLFFKALWVLL